jgi:phosphohistidine phosphatase
MSSGRTLLVLRHAKAAGEPGVNDIERPLTGGGRRDASAVGRWLLSRGITPDWVLCSSARRTRQTWQQMRAALGKAAPGDDAVIFEPRVYDAGAQDLLDLVNEQPNEAHTLLTVGHNPASGQLVAVLTRRLDIAFPACALAVIRVGESWAAVAPGGGELADLWIPRSPELPGPGTPITGAAHAPGPCRPGRRPRNPAGSRPRSSVTGPWPRWPPPRPWTLRAGRARCPGTARLPRRRPHRGRPASR